MKPHINNDAAPSVGDHTKMIFLAGAIKWWWMAECKVCGHVAEPRDFEGRLCPATDHRGFDGPDPVPCVIEEFWDSPKHREYIAWRNALRAELIRRGHLTYAPHEAFKGTWVERAQVINDAGIQMADLMIIMSEPGLETVGTDEEILVAERYGTSVFWCPEIFFNSVEEAVDRIEAIMEREREESHG